ncbi:MAG: tRNA (adenosine(37)-N6)-dimethylallyltransferase MiaA [candidate division WOR-3 bacterium]|nr:tRNA (adenosine(37)-N6)-dimethylallyltransferase MiaA [candidate division WOR-3 bacterium]
MQEIITIIGPTGVGKTEVAIKIAEQFNGEIISADSRQVYKYLNIGTAKPTPEQRKRTVFHLIDFLEPDENYSCGNFARDAERLIEQIVAKGRLPIVCGGTGLYIRALFNPLHQLPQADKELKTRLQDMLKEKGLDFLYKKLLNIDPEWAKRIGPKDKQRILRGLEVYEITGKPLTALIKKEKQKAKYKPKYIGLILPRDELYKRIDERYEKMIEQGLVDEVKNILKMGFKPDCYGLRTIGYKEIVKYLQGEWDLETAIEKAKQHTRNFAKRQITWFKKIPEINWYNPVNLHGESVLENLIKKLSGKRF